MGSINTDSRRWAREKGSEGLVCAVVLNWNGIEDTSRCVHSLEQSSYPNLRIIIVDNKSSHDEASQLQARFPHHIVLRNDENYGYAEGNNRGLAAVLVYEPEFLLVLNNDTVVPYRLVERLVDCAKEHPRAGAVGPTVMEPNGRVQSAGAVVPWHFGLPIILKAPIRAAPYRVDYVSGACILIRACALKRTGFFDPAFFLYAEERDWCHRARQAGYDIFVEPQAHVVHNESSTTSKVQGIKIFYTSRNCVLFVRKHAGLVRRLAFFSHLIITGLRYTTLSLKIRDFKPLRFFLKGAVAGFRTEPGVFVPPDFSRLR